MWRDYKTENLQNHNSLSNHPHKRQNLEEIAAAKRNFLIGNKQPHLETKLQKLNNMKKGLIDHPKFLLGHTKNDKIAANYHLLQQKNVAG